MRPETQAAIKEGMRRVTQTPKGTAAYAFSGYRVPTAGKTGSAENQGPPSRNAFAPSRVAGLSPTTPRTR